jgi:hypothetical protein
MGISGSWKPARRKSGEFRRDLIGAAFSVAATIGLYENSVGSVAYGLVYAEVQGTK